MIINLKKFGSALTSRQFGLEAFNAFRPSLKDVSNNELIKINFEEVETLSPSWAEEFLIPLHNMYKDRLKLQKSQNSAIIATVELLEETNNIRFNFTDQ